MSGLSPSGLPSPGPPSSVDAKSRLAPGGLTVLKNVIILLRVLIQMGVSDQDSKARRREFLQTLAAVGAGAAASSYGISQFRLADTGTVLDRLWMFGSPVNSDYEYVHQRSVMTAVEANFYFGVPNVIMVQDHPGHSPDSSFKAWEPPFEQYALPLRLLKRIEWSVVGGGGVTKGWETHQVLAMAHRTPNFVGIYMDDFFRDKAEGKGKLATFTPDELQALQQRLKGSEKKLDLNVTLYTYQLNPSIADHLAVIDKVTLWTWKSAELANLDRNLSTLRKLAPKARIMLGCYLVEYDEGASIPIPAMQHQCELGFERLRDGQIEGMVFIGNTVMDLGFEAVEWTREWIQKVGETRL